MLKAVEKIVALAEEKNITFPEAVLLLDSKESGISVEEIRARMSERLADMRRSVREACANTIPCRIEQPMGAKLRAHGGGRAGGVVTPRPATGGGGGPRPRPSAGKKVGWAQMGPGNPGHTGRGAAVARPYAQGGNRGRPNLCRQFPPRRKGGGFAQVC